MSRWIVAVLIGIVLAVACGPAPEEATAPPAGPAEVPPEALERARGAVGAMGSRLMAALMEQLKQGGPVAAVRVCSEVAPAVSAEQSVDGLNIRRVSLKVRNPQDRPDDYERAMLLAWEPLAASGQLPAESAEVVDLEGRRALRYMKPIVVMKPCLSCHGDLAEMEPALRAVLDERYPGDEATGYADGDLRGAFTVVIEF